MAMSEKARKWSGEELLRCISVLGAQGVFMGRSRSEALRQFWAIADELTRELSCFPSLDDLVMDFKEHGYRPTIRPDRGVEYRALADAYDHVAKLYGFSVMAYRG
jgi:hypothetical protein